MRKFKCIKEYPGSPKLGTINGFNNGVTLGLHLVENQPEFWEEIIEKDYEILSFVCTVDLNSLKKGMIVNRIENSFLFEYKELRISDIESKFLEIPHWNIHSIKKLSDDEIFTINDNTKYGCIDKFYIKNDLLLATTVLEASGRYLKDLEKIKQPLFKTEDGVDIFEDDTFWILDILNFTVPVRAVGRSFNNYKDKYLDFSTKEKAEEYILMNKKSLSVEDVLSVWSELSGNTRESLLSHSILMFRIIKFLKNK